MGGVKLVLRWEGGLTAWSLADDPMGAVLAGAGLPQARVALDPEAGVGRQHAQVGVLHLPVCELHLSGL